MDLQPFDRTNRNRVAFSSYFQRCASYKLRLLSLLILFRQLFCGGIFSTLSITANYCSWEYSLNIFSAYQLSHATATLCDITVARKKRTPPPCAQSHSISALKCQRHSVHRIQWTNYSRWPMPNDSSNKKNATHQFDEMCWKPYQKWFWNLTVSQLSCDKAQIVIRWLGTHRSFHSHISSNMPICIHTRAPTPATKTYWQKMHCINVRWWDFRYYMFKGFT